MSQKNIITAVLNGTPVNGWTIFKFNTLRWFFMTFSMFILAAITLGASLIFFWEYVNGGSLSDVPTEEKVFGSIMLFIGLISMISFLLKLKSLFFVKSNILVYTDDRVVVSWNGKVRDYLYSDISEPIFHYTVGKNSFYHNKYIEFKSKTTGKYVRIGYKEYYKSIQEIYRVLLNKLT